MSEPTPMMKQYQKVKDKNKDAIIFFRLGDFYEMFNEDAILASKELEITLTKRHNTPMCGIPHHAVDNYVGKLIDKGYKVGICEQIEDPKKAKGIVERDVVRIITPGTLIENNLLQDNHNYLVALSYLKNEVGICYTDISTGEFYGTEVPYGDKKSDNNTMVFDEIYRINPREILLIDKLADNQRFIKNLRKIYNGIITKIEVIETKDALEKKLTKQFKVNDYEQLNFSHSITMAASMIIDFLFDTQKRNLDYINRISIYYPNNFMVLDYTSRRNLELIETQFTKEKKGSLLWILDKTKTVMGRRLIKEWLENPLMDIDKIVYRQDGIAAIISNIYLYDDIAKFLNNIYDIERLATRVSYGTANPKDLLSLKQSILYLPNLYDILINFDAPIVKDMLNGFDDLQDIYNLIELSIKDDASINVREGDIIKDDYNQQIDDLRDIARGGKSQMLAMETYERENTGIKNLKIGFNKVFGYYIEVTKSNLNMVPEYFIRKQTLANCERFFTPELKEYESKVLNAKESLADLEYDEFQKIKEYISKNVNRILYMAAVIATVDVLTSLAKVAVENDYVRPTLDQSMTINIKEGRHPVVEKVSEEEFINNDVLMDNDKNQIAIITGPNMSGKSTYMRQVALIIIMAQMGSYVPASSCHLGIVDRVFTRIGASDDLVGGNSTFMVEMTETANIINNATDRSFVILDEIGRGTSTFDGMAIAWSVITHLSDGDVRPKTLFATHYHQLIELETYRKNIKNYHIAVKKTNDDLIFLRKIMPGGTDKSYGLEVAKLAGMPSSLIREAKDVLRTLEKDNDSSLSHICQTETQITLGVESYSQHHIIDELAELDIDNLTPIAAHKILIDWQKLLKDNK